MTIEQQILTKLRGLPPERQREVLNFLDSLKLNGPPAKLRSLEGFLEHFHVDITEEDITEARREMWGNFPRDIS